MSSEHPIFCSIRKYLEGNASACMPRPAICECTGREDFRSAPSGVSKHSTTVRVAVRSSFTYSSQLIICLRCECCGLQKSERLGAKIAYYFFSLLCINNLERDELRLLRQRRRCWKEMRSPVMLLKLLHRHSTSESCSSTSLVISPRK